MRRCRLSRFMLAPRAASVTLPPWTDNADNEEHFMIMRKPQGGTYDDIDMVTFNTTSYHDSSVTAGTTYVYQVMAMNGKGEAASNEVTFTP